MKKLFASLRTLAVLTVLTLFSTLTASAQIRTEFFGLKIGQSTKAEVKQTLAAKGMKYKVYNEPYSPYNIVSNRVKLGAYVWDDMTLYFYDNTLCRIKFTMSVDRKHSQTYLSQAYKNIAQAYSQLYGAYQLEQPEELSYPSKAITPFCDDTTYACVKRIEEQTNIPEMLVIDFMNCELVKELNPSVTSINDFHELAGFE